MRPEWQQRRPPSWWTRPSARSGRLPDAATLQKIYTFPALPAKVQRLMTRSWTKIKSGK